MLLISLLLCFFIINNVESERINIVMLGATGNLAEKYLWQGLYDISTDGLEKGEKIHVFPAASKSPEISQPILDRILSHNITERSNFKNSKEIFLNNVASYSQLRNEEHFGQLDKKIKEASKNEDGRLFYLSIPPKLFGSVADNINKYMRPHNGGWLRVIVEKPFGVDLESAKLLAQGLFQSLDVKEVLLVDHYMGKVTMHGLRDFVNHHKVPTTTEKFNGLQYVEIGMLETDDCKGRTGFYDEVGVLRDTIQNHLTMMFAVFGMGTEYDETERAKEEPIQRKSFISTLPKVIKSHIKKIGQYKSYNDHVNEDRIKWNEPLLEEASKTPTFLHIEVKLNNPSQWAKNVPFHFISGKALKARRSYVEVVFKSGDFLVFNLQGKASKVDEQDGAFIFASKGMGKFKVANGWKIEEINDPPGFIARPIKKETQAYEFLLRAGLEGKTENFVKLDEVLVAWEAWSPLLNDISKLNKNSYISYDHGTNFFVETQMEGSFKEMKDEL